MERVVDKAIVFACSLACLIALPWEPYLVSALLASVTATALVEVLPWRLRMLPSVAYCLVALVLPTFATFVSLAAYDLTRAQHPLLRVCWLLPVLAATMRLPLAATAILVLACLLACLLSWRTGRMLSEQVAYRRLNDDVREASLALEAKNRGLREKQDLEVRLATLAERDRIAREIHDNVGHLLTRSIMQVEALQVVHRNDEQVRGELSQVGATLHEAMDTVRASVHDLHDDAFDLETQIQEATKACAPLEVVLDYQADIVPAEVGYCFVAIVRESLSNVVKHSDATRASMSVSAYPAFYRLVVHDNGSVPPPAGVLTDGEGASSSAQVRRGIGLTTMADRAHALGGVLRIDYDHGFRVFVTIPREQEA